MCNLLEIVERVKETGLDSVLAHLGLRSEQLRALHANMGPELQQRSRADLVELGLPEDVATNYREFMKRLAEWRGLCDRKFYSLTLSGVSEWMLKYAKKASSGQGHRASSSGGGAGRGTVVPRAAWSGTTSVLLDDFATERSASPLWIKCNRRYRVSTDAARAGRDSPRAFERRVSGAHARPTA